jgi:alkaline phosphatase
MFKIVTKLKKFIIVIGIIILANFTLTPPVLAETKGNGINVIIMIGDGMGWQMTRAAAIANGGKFYRSGKGQGLNMQTLTGYTYSTTYGTILSNKKGIFNTYYSALDGTNPTTGLSPIAEGFSYNPLPFNPGISPKNPASDCTNTNNGGNLVGYDVKKGGPNPWTPLTPAKPGNYDKEYIRCNYPDSANTATTLYTGVKTYSNALGVDIFEKDLKTILQYANDRGKSTGLVTSVPITHATPGAATANVNKRNKYDSDYPALDSILQEAIRPDVVTNKFLPTVLIGAGHPLDLNNTTDTGGKNKYTYIRESTYNYLKENPTKNNKYGYQFVERGAKAATVLRKIAASLNPNNGDRLLGLYGARGQAGNIPVSSANGDYSHTGLSQFSLFGTTKATNQIPNPDKIRPLNLGETNEQFIAKERDENPTLAQMTQAALTILGQDKDGFWLMVEGGDIDWAAHDNNMDNLIGTVLDFDKSVKTVIDWIKTHGGWQKNLLIVTADHDHYLTLNDDFPKLLKKYGAENLTYSKHTPKEAGHFWGSDPQRKYLWGNHSNRPVPVYYQGFGSSTLTNYIGKGYKSYGFDIPGIAGGIDQSHIFQAMLSAINAPKK